MFAPPIVEAQMKKKLTEDYLRYDEEDQTDEARTNEEVLEEIERMA